MTDFVRFTKIYTNCSEIQNLWKNQLLHFGWHLRKNNQYHICIFMKLFLLLLSVTLLFSLKRGLKVKNWVRFASNGSIWKLVKLGQVGLKGKLFVSFWVRLIMFIWLHQFVPYLSQQKFDFTTKLISLHRQCLMERKKW